MTPPAQTTLLDELEVNLLTPPYVVGPYIPVLRSPGFLGLGDLSEDEWVKAENLIVGLHGQPAHVAQDHVTALTFAGDQASLAVIQRLAVAADAAATAVGGKLSSRSYRAYARAWRAWREQIVAAYRAGRIRSPALEERADLLRAIARRLDQLPHRAAQWDDAEVRVLRERLSPFDRAHGLTFPAQF